MNSFQLTPEGYCPVLELDDGTRFDETMAICKYLEDLYPEPPLLGTTSVERAEIECYRLKGIPWNDCHP